MKAREGTKGVRKAWAKEGSDARVRVGTDGFARRYNISSYSWMETGCRGGREDRERNTG